MSARRVSVLHAPRTGAGFSLIELMIAMVLGLVVIAGVAAVFLANMRSYHTNTALADVQDSSRVAFELMARDIRDAGLTGCSMDGHRLANVLNNGPAGSSSVAWWSDWDGSNLNAVRGYEGDQDDPAVVTGTGAGERITGTDSVSILGAGDVAASVKSHTGTSAQITLNESSSDLATGDIVIVCDPDHGAITQLTSYTDSTVTAVHNTGSGNPGNCSKGLGYPTVCTATGSTYAFPPNSLVSKLTASDWYVGTNPAGGTSLYRKFLQNAAGTPTASTQEMVRNVTGVQIQYHPAGGAACVDADVVTVWSAVDAVKVTLSLESADKRASTDAGAIKRTFTATTTVRNRVP